MSIFILDGTLMSDKASAYKHLAKTLRLSDYFGKNLDALADELSSFDESCYIVINNSGKLVENLGEYGQSMLRVFIEASEQFKFNFIEK